MGKGSSYELATVKQGKDYMTEILSLMSDYEISTLNGGRISKNPKKEESKVENIHNEILGHEIVVYSPNCLKQRVPAGCNANMSCAYDADHGVCGNKRAKTETEGSYCRNDNAMVEKSECDKYGEQYNWCHTNEFSSWDWDYCTPLGEDTAELNIKNTA